MKKVILFVFLLIASYVFGADGYIRDGATGNDDGTTWTDAYDNITDATFVRGNTYWVADGIYEVVNDFFFNTANSGTDRITIKKAVHGAENGSDDGNWQSTYGDGQAIFRWTTNENGINEEQMWWISTDYWTFDGQVGGGPDDWDGSGSSVGSMGFKMTGPTDENLASVAFVRLATTDTSLVADHIVFKHCEMSADTYKVKPPTAEDPAADVMFQGQISDAPESAEGKQGVSDFTVSYCYFHAIFIVAQLQDANNVLFEYNYFKQTYDDDPEAGAHQTEALRIQNSENVTIRYNLFEDATNGSACIWLVPGSGAGGHDQDTTFKDVFIYGNVFYDTDDSQFGVSTGAISLRKHQDLDNEVDTLYVYNNTFANIKASNGHCGIQIGYSAHTDIQIRNNIFYDCENTTSDRTLFLQGEDTLTHNWYETCVFDSVNQEAWLAADGTNGQLGSGDPFTNLAGGDLTLTGATLAGETLGAPYTTDMFGNIRGDDGTWDRGALEFDSGEPGPYWIGI